MYVHIEVSDYRGSTECGVYSANSSVLPLDTLEMWVSIFKVNCIIHEGMPETEIPKGEFNTCTVYSKHTTTLSPSLFGYLTLSPKLRIPLSLTSV